jgi:hypothetical protein
MQLTEGAPSGDGGVLLPWRAVSLGRIWNPNATSIYDLAFDIRSQSEMYNIFDALTLEGDYFPDGVVNQTDYNTWRQYFGSTTVLFADGSLNGIVDAADYVVWRKNLGKSIPSTAIGSGDNVALPALSANVKAVPEPSTFALGFVAFGCLLHGLTRRRR